MKTVIKIIFAIILANVSYAGYAEQKTLSFDIPTEYINDTTVESGAITEHKLYCNDGTEASILFPDTSITLNFAPRDEPYECYWETIAHNKESDPSNLTVFSVGWVKTKPPVAHPIDNNTVTLSWTAPTENTDGSELADLAGFKVYHGPDENNLNNIIEVDDPQQTQLVSNAINDHFAVTAINSSGIESRHGNIVTKVN